MKAFVLAAGFLCVSAVHAADLQPAALVPGTVAPGTGQATAPAPGQATFPVAQEQRDIRAQLAPRNFTTLAAEVGAKISSLPLAEGGSFKKGQLLVGFDCSLQQAQLNKARAGLSAAEKTWNANKRLSQLNSIGEVELQVSEAEVMKNRADVSLMSTMIGKCSISAPFSGRVAEQKMREQQFAQPGQPIIDILDDSVLEIEFLAPSRWLSWLKSGTLLQLRVDETDKNYPARITRIGARVDPVSQSIKLVATIDGQHPELIAGMSGTVLLAPPSAP
jgi:RND family efflux transporter MFP subunit